MNHLKIRKSHYFLALVVLFLISGALIVLRPNNSNAQCGPDGCPPVQPATTKQGTLYTSTGWDVPSSADPSIGSSSCGPCNQLLPNAPQIKANYNVVTDSAEMQKNKIDGTPTLVTNDKTKIVGPDGIKNELNKKPDQGVFCGVVSPGQSLVNFDDKNNDAKKSMWGQAQVALFTDPKAIFGNDVKIPTPKCDKTDDKSILATCALDFMGAKMKKEGKTTGFTPFVAEFRQSELNYWFFGNKDKVNVNPTGECLGVSTEDDFNALYPDAQKSYPAGVTLKDISNEKETTDYMNNPANANKPTDPSITTIATQPKKPIVVKPTTKKEHEEYKTTYPPTEDPLKPKNGYTPAVPAGSTARVKPGVYTARTGTSALIAQNDTAVGQDMTITDLCQFILGKAGPGPGGNGWKPGGSQGNGGGSGGGGDSGGSKMPQLPQIPKGSGGSPSSQSPAPGSSEQPSDQPKPTAQPKQMPDGTLCTSTINPVCGNDGKTYVNQCQAEHSSVTNPAGVAKEGACEGDGMFDQLSQILQDLTGSGIPESVVTNVINVLTTLMGDIFPKTGTLV